MIMVDLLCDHHSNVESQHSYELGPMVDDSDGPLKLLNWTSDSEEGSPVSPQE